MKYDLCRPGTTVHIGGGTEATVHAAQVDWGSAVSYRVVWWEDGIRNDEWIHESEIENTDED